MEFWGKLIKNWVFSSHPCFGNDQDNTYVSSSFQFYISILLKEVKADYFLVFKSEKERKRRGIGGEGGRQKKVRAAAGGAAAAAPASSRLQPPLLRTNPKLPQPLPLQALSPFPIFLNLSKAQKRAKIVLCTQQSVFMFGSV